jgi:hypothetical protein
MTTSPIHAEVDELLAESNGILRLEPAWVARDFLPGGRRLGLPDSAYDVGELGFICERWPGSTTRADKLFRANGDMFPAGPYTRS